MKLPTLKIALHNETKNKTEKADARQSEEDVRFFLFLFWSVTLRDERSKANFHRLTGVTEVPLCECVALPASVAVWCRGPAFSLLCLCVTI